MITSNFVDALLWPVTVNKVRGNQLQYDKQKAPSNIQTDPQAVFVSMELARFD
jgi:hypothetical protein